MLGLPGALEAAIIYRSNEGWSVEGDPASQVEGSAVEQMRKAEELEARGKLGDALDAYRGLVKRYGLSVLAPKAQRKIGILLERSGDYDKAFNSYSTYLQKYPKGEDFEAVVESMFKIAKLFLKGEKKKILGSRSELDGGRGKCSVISSTCALQSLGSARPVYIGQPWKAGQIERRFAHTPRHNAVSERRDRRRCAISDRYVGSGNFVKAATISRRE